MRSGYMFNKRESESECS